MTKFNVGDKVRFTQEDGSGWSGLEAEVVRQRPTDIFGNTISEPVAVLRLLSENHYLYPKGTDIGGWPDSVLELATEEPEPEDEEYDLTIEAVDGEEYNFTVTLTEDAEGEGEYEAYQTVYVGDFVLLVFEHDDGEFSIRADLTKSISFNKA